ncbi:SDR family oxidoreductase [Noviherbaspirillum galbum]|uniref:SDR family oxidoreductase n=1 Tax=Noviherbaspirillum galbum TaxID=2709383 RepID=A0A6B3SXD5_9BURK|nr:SDR family oxidoreductase [Noviherbaspirillum galbum]NEX63152.1 SDR family oxidoreductase [Noviherbaspirillum galbum]
MTPETGKGVLVTGAAKRIGRVIALALARRGWHVAVHYHRSAAEAQATVDEIVALGVRAAAVCCDLADEPAVKSLVPQAQAALGVPLRGLVNNASLFSQDDPADMTLSSFDAHMHANVAAPVWLAQALHAAIPDDGRGAVVNLLDQKLFNMNPDFLSYTLSKAALQTATTMLAQALAPRLRVVGVAPGITLVSGDQTEEGFAKAHAKTPLGRSSTPEDVAETVCFAMDNPAITGTTILVDGGQHLIPLQRDVMFIAN